MNCQGLILRFESFCCCFNALVVNTISYIDVVGVPNNPIAVLRVSRRQKKKKKTFLDSLGDIVVALAQAFVTANFGVLTLSLLHQSLQFGVIALRDGLGLHLDRQIAASALDAFSDALDGFVQECDALVFVERGAGKHIQWRRDKLNLDLGISVGALSSVASLCSSQGRLDGINALVAEASHFHIGSDLGSLRGKSLADVQLQLVLNRLAGKRDVIPDLRVTITLGLVTMLL